MSGYALQLFAIILFSLSALAMTLPAQYGSKAATDQIAEESGPDKTVAATPAQDSKEQPAPDKKPDVDLTGPRTVRFNKVHAEWQELNEKLNGFGQEYRQADEKRREELRKEFDKGVRQAEKLQSKLRDSAREAYEESPNASEDATSTLLGFVALAISEDDYVAADQLAQLLIDNDCEAVELDDFAGQIAYAQQDFDAAEKHLKRARKNGVISRSAMGYLMDVEEAKKAWSREVALRKAEQKADDLPRVKIETSKGAMVIELFENEAPETVGNFVSLVEDGFYDGLNFHRVLPNFMAQGGCPDGTGTGGPGYSIHCECRQENRRAHFAGSLSMAHAGRDTGGSQFFLTFRRTSHLDGKHTVFGRVIKGLDVLSKLERIDPQDPFATAEPDRIVKATVLRKRDHKYQPNKVVKEQAEDAVQPKQDAN